MVTIEVRVASLDLSSKYMMQDTWWAWKEKIT
jgi:hypothetical protein